VPKSRDIRRIVAEFLLIVLGVVAALGVDRWVQGVDESHAEREYLRLVLSDLEANVEIYELMAGGWAGSRDAGEALAAAIADGVRPPDAGLMMAVYRAGSMSTVPPRDGSFRDLEATGNIRLISDPALRAQIVSYFTQEIRFGRPMLEDRVDLRFRAFAREHVPAGLPAREFCSFDVPAFECQFDGAPDGDALWSALTENPDVARMLNSRLADAMAGAGLTEGWLTRTRELRAEVEEALGR
jgi:hypothetical protein